MQVQRADLLAALVPLPRVPLVRSAGCVAPHSTRREAMLPTPRQQGTAGARFQSLTEPWADTTSHVGKFILTVFAGLAEFERDLIRERARVGRVAAYNRTRVTIAALSV